MKKRLERACPAKIDIEPTKDIVEVDAPEQVLTAESRHPGKSARIVFGALFWIGQHRIRFSDFLETILRTR
jgi:hypothetical protein